MYTPSSSVWESHSENDVSLKNDGIQPIGKPCWYFNARTSTPISHKQLVHDHYDPMELTYNNWTEPLSEIPRKNLASLTTENVDTLSCENLPSQCFDEPLKIIDDDLEKQISETKSPRLPFKKRKYTRIEDEIAPVMISLFNPVFKNSHGQNYFATNDDAFQPSERICWHFNINLSGATTEKSNQNVCKPLETVCEQLTHQVAETPKNSKRPLNKRKFAKMEEETVQSTVLHVCERKVTEYHQRENSITETPKRFKIRRTKIAPRGVRLL